MTAKIFRSIFVTSIVSFIIALAISIVYSYGYYNEEVRVELYREATYIESGIKNYGDGYLETIDYNGVRVSIIEPDGRVSYDSYLTEEELSRLENHSEREEVRAALESGAGYAKRQSDTISKETVYYAVALDDGRILRVCSTHLTVMSVIISTFSAMTAVLLIILLVAFLVARALSSSIVRPINEMNLDSPERSGVYDELKPVVNKIISQNRKISKQMDELRLRESEFVSITSNMNEGMIVINSRAEVLSCNDSARTIFGISRELPKNILSFNLTQSLRDAVSRALRGESSFEEMTKGEKHYEIILTPVLSDSVVDGAIILVIDDTEKEEREQLRREFTSNISHELKTPLTSITGFAELISCGMAEGEEARHFADNIRSEAKRLVTLVGDIIRLTRLDGREIPYDGEVDIFSAAEEVVARLENIAKSAEVSISLSGEHCRVLGNAEIIEQIIYNLTDNAIKYNRRGGRVEINVSECEGRALLSVKDNGIGIPMDKQDRVFERFYRVDKSHSREIGGTGLGLSIVKHAAAYHKAEISLVSEEGVGTEITVRFPSK